MSKKKPRTLRPDEEDLWDKVRQNTVPLHRSKPQLAQSMRETIVQPTIKPLDIPSFRIGAAVAKTATAQPILPSLSNGPASTPIQMDRKHFHKIKRGKVAPQGRIDLHGMTLAQAHPALIRFILDARAKEKRLVLVITGKGKDKDIGGPIPVRRGVLKHQVPQWLQSGVLSSAVMQVTPAHHRHGGSGAYYVYLRRNR